MKINLMLLTILMSLNLFAQNSFDANRISGRTGKIVKKIEKINVLMSSAVGYAGVKPEQWDNFEKLKTKASKQELIELTNHPNGVVRSYAFWALSHDRNVDLFKIVKNHLNDNEFIYTQFGCIGDQEKVGDFFIQVMTPQYVDIDSKKLNLKEFQKLDSLLIYVPNNLSSKSDAIRRAKATEKLYPKIRELVTEENNPSALVTLAKYQKEQDIEIIKNFRGITDKAERGFYFTYSAISQFPNLEFLPLLEENLKNTLDNTHFSTEWRELYKAIASYKNDKSVELLKVPFTQVQHQSIRKYHIDFVFGAILEFQDTIYDELLWRIWEEEYLVSIDSYKYLLSINPSRTYELTKKEFIKDYEVKNSDFIPKLNRVEYSDNFHEYLLNIIIVNDKELSNKIISQQIEKADVHILPLFTSKTNQQERFIEPLFNRLEDAWNAHVYLNLIKTLILYKDDEINKRILEVRKRNPNLNKDWGGESLNKLLKDNNIK